MYVVKVFMFDMTLILQNSRRNYRKYLNSCCTRGLLVKDLILGIHIYLLKRCVAMVVLRKVYCCVSGFTVLLLNVQNKFSDHDLAVLR